MSYLPPIAVLLLMLSTGMSLNLTQLVATWRRLTPGMWLRLLLATFIVPPAIALGLAKMLPISMASMAGLYLIAVAPGAPLMTRNVAKHGFDMQMAACYQVWSALMAPLMIPLLVAGAAWLYGREIWVSPLEVLLVIAKQQFAPMFAGMALMHFAPAFSAKLQRPLNIIGNVLLTAVIILLLIKLGSTLAAAGPWVGLAALTLAASCLVGTRLLMPSSRTLAVSNVNRHVGLALLLCGTHVQNAVQALPAIAAYAIAAPLVMVIYAKLTLRKDASACL
ncbi:MAG: hypothetical protein RL693_2462 [Verrucomicrobiota bacterium]|jgi:BASS family bile acid:Na+ symporter